VDVQANVNERSFFLLFGATCSKDPTHSMLDVEQNGQDQLKKDREKVVEKD
jgi:hypothetical protein